MLNESAATFRLCERFGQDPQTWPGTLTPNEVALLLGYEMLRTQEQARERAAVVSAIADILAAHMGAKRA